MFFFLRKVFCFGFQRVAGAKPLPGAGGFAATDSPDSPTNSSEEPQNIYDLGDGEVDFPACHRVLKAASLKLWLIVDLDIARQGPRVSYERCGAYVVDKLEPIYV